MPTNIGPKIGVDGEKEFRQEIAQINTSLKTMGAGMDKVTSSFIGNENSVEALTAKNELLQSKFDELSKKADVQKARLKELDDAGVDPTSAGYQKLLQDLYKTETQMNKTEAEINGNVKEMDNLGEETEDTGEAMEKGAKKTSVFADVLKANLLSEAIIGGVKALGEGLKKLGQALLDAAEAADELNTLSVKTGIATDELQKFQYASESIDVSLDTLTGSYTKLTAKMADAAEGSGAASDAFKKLGVQVTKDDGTLRDRNEVFQETIAALGKIENATERDAAAMDIFGKSAQELNPLIMGGAEALQELGDHAEQARLLLSGDALDALAGLNDRFGVLKQTASLAGQQFLAQFAEPLTEGINTVIGYVERLVSAFQKGGFSSLGEVVGEIATDIAAKVTSYLPKVAEFATTLITTLAEGLVGALPAVLESAVSIVTTLANGIAEALPALIPVAVDTILALVDTLTNPDSIGELVDAAIAITIALANGLIDALPRLLEKAPVIVTNLVTAIVENVPKLLESAWEIIDTLVTGIVDNLDQIGAAAGEIIGTVVLGIKDLAVDLWNTGKSIVEGIWQGISDSWEWLKEKVSGFFTGIVDSVKGVLGIASPSKVFAGIGDNMAAGIGVSFDRSMDKVEHDMMSNIPVPDVAFSGAGGLSAQPPVWGAGTVEEITIPVEVGGVELARALYRHIVGEGQRIGSPAIA